MKFKDEVYQIIGVAMEVYNVLGPGFLEPIYQEAMEIELDARGIPYKAQSLIPIFYKERKLSREYIADLVCFDEIIVELKAVERLNKTFQSQLLNYLHGARKSVGVLINFGHEDGLEWKRMII
ncbi:GxxExxY protein [Desulfonatronovibrio magnus]|uniref:GxxExxY protein n=1 Tax=Desulfonatronovibrio magnus TaxID=698827 RepID=UPI0005EBBB8B|nr:GxxExxY protein [Desulfonatronovibrio magnus]